MHEIREDWAADVIRGMFRWGVDAKELASEVIVSTTVKDGATTHLVTRRGINTSYLSSVLNGKKKFASIDSKLKTEEAIKAAMKRLAERVDLEVRAAKAGETDSDDD